MTVQLRGREQPLLVSPTLLEPMSAQIRSSVREGLAALNPGSQPR
jgi:hypothetical protein